MTHGRFKVSFWDAFTNMTKARIYRFRARIGAFLVLLICVSTAIGQPQQPRTLLAVFAHPDDETSVSPVLAHYARSGVKVYLAIATKGEKGATAHAGIATGEPLAAARRSEAECACQQLGIEPPILFGLNDGELGAPTRPPGKNMQMLVKQIRELITKLHPQAVVTWGPEGGDGHPDHRLVSDAVTEVVQSERVAPRLYYVGITAHQANLLNAIWPIPWGSVDTAYLTVEVSYDDKDRDAYHDALACHKSQFTAEQLSEVEHVIDQSSNGKAYFRPWFGNRKSHDLFK